LVAGSTPARPTRFQSGSKTRACLGKPFAFPGDPQHPRQELALVMHRERLLWWTVAEVRLPRVQG
jgi:hypothetical protein